MATRVKYKFGDDEFDLKDYIHNLETNYQSYVASKNWNEGQQQEFKNAFDKSIIFDHNKHLINWENIEFSKEKLIEIKQF